MEQSKVRKTAEQLQQEAASRKTTLDELQENVEVGNYLKNVPLLSRLTDQERNKLGSQLNLVSFAADDIIVRQGDIGSEFYILKSGKASVVLEDHEAGTKSEVATLKSGDYFGEQALLNAATRAATVRATEPVECYTLDQKKFESIFSKNKLKVQFEKRGAVSAEKSSESDMSQMRNVDKTDEEREFLDTYLKNHVLFESIDEFQRQNIISMMWKQDVEENTDLIKQGEVGDNFYVIQKGEFSVTINVADETDPSKTKNLKVNHLKEGSCFGELALMYNSPRAATVTATCKALVWEIDRQSFRRAVRAMKEKELGGYAKFLDSVSILKPLTKKERLKVAEALEEKSFLPEEQIIKQGDAGDTFYIVKSGKVSVQSAKESGAAAVEVAQLSKGDYFGERALLLDEPRSATVVAMEKTMCLVLNREGFTNLLGPLSELLQERSADRDKKTEEAKATGTVVQAAASTMLNIPFSDLSLVGHLGKGSFGLVSLMKNKDGNTYALKKLSKSLLEEMDQHSHVVNEKTVMERLNHPFITALRSTYKDPNNLYFLMDVSLGGDLFGLLRNQTLFEEKVARFYAASIILAFEHMHDKELIHRDLKPENVLIHDDGYIKLTDFGFAKEMRESDRTWTLCGTPDYLAPEMIQGTGHGKAVDWWTVGILIFEMLASYPPFYDDDPMQTYAKITKGKVTYPKHFSRAAVDLVKRLLHPKATKRLGATRGGAKMIKAHPWFDGFDWDALYNKKLSPPFKPEIQNAEDLGNFDTYGIEEDEEEAYSGEYTAWDDIF